MRRIARHVLGWGCLGVGVIGLFVPVLQGWLLIATGALLLSPDVPFFARVVARLEIRFPRLRHGLKKLRRRLNPGSPDGPRSGPPPH
ncbi:MAG: hypothetical protein ACHQQS_08085 [Thermoanaerobaculales bacterium]